MSQHELQQHYETIKQFARACVAKHRELEISEWQDLLTTLLQAGYPPDLVNEFGETVNQRYTIVGADWRQFFEQMEQFVLAPAIDAMTPQALALPAVGDTMTQASTILAEVQNKRGVEMAQECLAVYGASAVGELSGENLLKFITTCKLTLKDENA